MKVRFVLAALFPIAALALATLPAAAETPAVGGRLVAEPGFEGAGATALLRVERYNTWYGRLSAHGLPPGEYEWGIREDTDLDGDGVPDMALYYGACGFVVAGDGLGGCYGTPYHQGELRRGIVAELYRSESSGALILVARGTLG